MTTRRILITGSNRGLGLGLCAAYAERGDHVLAACRRRSPELEALAVEIIEGVDLASDDTITRLPQAVGDEPLDAVIANAGVNLDSSGLLDIQVEQLATMLDVNALGAVRTVLGTLPRLRDGGKIMLVSSLGVVPLGILRTRTTGNYGYRMSKAALVSFGHALAEDVRDRGIAVAMTAPGRVDTPMLRRVISEGRAAADALDDAGDPLEVGRRLRDRLDALTLDASPALDRDLDGNPAVPAEALELLRAANLAQLAHATPDEYDDHRPTR